VQKSSNSEQGNTENLVWTFACKLIFHFTIAGLNPPKLTSQGTIKSDRRPQLNEKIKSHIRRQLQGPCGNGQVQINRLEE
jgi:hypothetical protein